MGLGRTLDELVTGRAVHQVLFKRVLALRIGAGGRDGRLVDRLAGVLVPLGHDVGGSSGLDLVVWFAMLGLLRPRRTLSGGESDSDDWNDRWKMVSTLSAGKPRLCKRKH
jgi:hypothetical protein